MKRAKLATIKTIVSEVISKTQKGADFFYSIEEWSMGYGSGGDSNRS